MIKCEVSVCGTINKEAIIRTNKDGKSFMSFVMNIVLPTTSGSKVLDVSVLCDCEKNNDVSKFCVGTRLNASGTLLFKKRGENLYLNLYAEGFEFENVAAIDSIKGSMLFRGKLGKTIEEKTDKKGNKYRTFSGVSSEKVSDGFEYIWISFFDFSQVLDDAIKPETKVEIAGTLDLSFFKEKLTISSRIKSVSPYVPVANTSNQE
jgi:hypothetical protein